MVSSERVEADISLERLGEQIQAHTHTQQQWVCYLGPPDTYLVFEGSAE